MNTLHHLDEGAILVACKMRITQERLDNIPFLLKAMEEHQITDPGQIAYILATVAHECTFRCIPEIRARKNTPIWRMQERYWHTGYYGRGFAQITWKGNYRKFENLLNIPLVAKPELALDPHTSATILVLGMRDGLFSGVALRHFISGEKQDFMRARRIVNGNFQADRVAAHALRLLPLITPAPALT